MPKLLYKLSFIFLLSCHLLLASAQARLVLDHKEFVVRVEKVPIGQSTIFIPLFLNGKELELNSIDLRDVFIKNYLTRLEKNRKTGEFRGVSFSALKGKTLPKVLEAEIKVKISSSVDLSLAHYPRAVTLQWKKPWVFNKFSESFPEAVTGFEGAELTTCNLEDLDESTIKKRSQSKKKSSSDFYLKTFGESLIKSSQQNNKLKNKSLVHDRKPLLQSLYFFLLTPPKESAERFYIPILIKEPNLLSLHSNYKKLEVNQKAVLRVLENNILEVVSLDNKVLPANFKARGILQLSQSKKTLFNAIKLGPVLKEPAWSLDGVEVIISPAAITIKNKVFPLQFF